MTKACVKCGGVKSLADYYKDPKCSDGYRSDCKSCISAARKERYRSDEGMRTRIRAAAQKDPQKTQATGRRSRLRRYGLTPESFDLLFASQGRRCAICQSPDPGHANWSIDHDHAVGPSAVRGILCWHCNVGIGHFRDEVVRLIAAADYLHARGTEAASDSLLPLGQGVTS